MKGRRIWILLAVSLIATQLAWLAACEESAAARPQMAPAVFDEQIADNARKMVDEGRRIFRYDTFGSEAFWGDTLRLHEGIATISPKKALEVGLKVDAAALPADLADNLKKGKVNLEDPATTITLLKLNAVVGVTGFLDASGNRLRSVGIQCALCHSTVDDSLMGGIGRRRDGWPNRDLNVGAIINLSPDLKAVADLLKIDPQQVRNVLTSWGPGRFDAQLFLDGKAYRPDGKTAASLIPPAFGQAGVNLDTSTGFGTVTYWNAFVANIEMHGKGTFFDPRLNDPSQFPVAAQAKFGNLRSKEDMITSKLAALHFYQLAIPAPKPPDGSYDRMAADRGREIFEGKAKCATCHVPPLFTEPGWNMHKSEEIGIDDFQANRSPDRRYRTTPLKGLWARQKGGFYHDGRFATFKDVVEHYNRALGTGLSKKEMDDLIEYLKSL